MGHNMGLFNSAVGIILVALCGIVFGIDGTGSIDDQIVFNLKPKKTYHNTRVVEFPRTMSFQLGGLIVANDEYVSHEYGHYKQEIYLKRFYIPVIGTMSFIGNVFDLDYYELWSEKWADQLGSQ